MSARRVRQLFAIVLILAYAIAPGQSGMWVCASDGTPCPPAAHAKTRGGADRCCCGGGIFPQPDCCGHESSPASGTGAVADHCDDTDVFIATERDTARPGQGPVLRITHHVALLPTNACPTGSGTALTPCVAAARWTSLQSSILLRNRAPPCV